MIFLINAQLNIVIHIRETPLGNFQVPYSMGIFVE